MTEFHEERFIYKKPINEIVDKITSSKKNVVFIAGQGGSGKTCILNSLISSGNYKRPVIDGSIEINEYAQIYDYEVYKVYHVCLIIKKIINYIKKHYFVIDDLRFFEAYINNIFDCVMQIIMMYKYEEKANILNEEIIRNPEALLDELSFLIIYLNLEEMVVVLDNFDTAEYASNYYQKYLYDLLKKRVKLIATISDSSIINDENIKSQIGLKHEIISVNYSNDVFTVKRIFEKELNSLRYYSGNGKIYYMIDYFLDNDTVEEMIKKTNGDLDKMLRALRALYAHLDELTREEYDKYILNYIDQELENSNVYISRYLGPVRKLHLENLLF